MAFTGPGEEYVLIRGDFDARVGSRSLNDGEWCAVRGPHVVGQLNASDVELLDFLSRTNESRRPTAG